MKRPWSTWIFAAVISVSGASASMAGSGRIHDGKLDLSVMFTYAEADPDSWRPLFEEASALLWNATDGQLQLGKITVHTCQFDKPDTDVWILNNHAGAFANVLGLGADGHIFLSQTHKSVSGGALGQFGLVHEIGHYAFGLYDEYKGVVEAPFAESAEMLPGQRSALHYCVESGDPIACIMDGGTTVPPNNARTEFCAATAGGLSTRHNDGIEVGGARYVNFQAALNEESCWETIARAAALLPPSSVETGPADGLLPIEWEIESELSRIVICLDRSGSMLGEKMALAREAAGQLVDLLHVRTVLDGTTVAGEDLAITSFAELARVDFPMQELVNAETKDAAREAISHINASGSTYINLGLRASLDAIVGAGDARGCTESIVLVTDGRDSFNPHPPPDVLPELVARGVKVYAIGLGFDADVVRLQQLAEETGGQFFFAEEANDLADIFTTISADVRAGGLLGGLDGVTDGQDFERLVYVDSFLQEMTASLQWDAGVLDLILSSPTGDIITVESADIRDDVEAVVREGFLYIRVTEPEAGQWNFRVTPLQLEGPSAFVLTTVSEDREVTVLASTDQGEYNFPTPVHLRVDVTATVPVAGAEVSGQVLRPGGPPVAIQLYDDGQTAHGDEFADDGVYNVIFDQYAGDGVYEFQLTATNENGTGPSPDLPFVEDGDDAEPIAVPPFVRETSVSVVVTGYPSTVFGGLDFEPQTLDKSNAGRVVTCYLEAPGPFAIQNLDRTSLRLNGVFSPRLEPQTIGDHDDDGIPDLRLEFDRAPIQQSLPIGVAVEVRITGSFPEALPYVAADYITVIDPPRWNHAVAVPPVVIVGTDVTLDWQRVDDSGVTYAGYLSVDDGATWGPIFEGIVGDAPIVWRVTAPPTVSAQIMIQSSDLEGVVEMPMSSTFSVLTSTSSVPTPSSAFPDAFLSASPNPMTGNIALNYSLSRARDVRLDVYDASGRLVRRVASGPQQAGTHQATWNGHDSAGRPAAAGLYFYVFEAGAVRQSGKFSLIR